VTAPRDAPPPLGWSWWGEGVPYERAWARQRATRAAVQRGEGGEVLACLSHAPVITTGRRAAAGTASPEALAAAGVDYFETERGGLATWHGPGQLVGYALVDLRRRRLRVRELVCALEDGVIAWLGGRGVSAGRRAGAPGVWVGRDKICAVGLNVDRGVSMHGFALNLTCDLSAYALIVPCGIRDGGVTSLGRLTPGAPAPEEAAPGVAAAVIRAMSLRSGLDA